MFKPNKNTFIINLIGGPGCGKSTVAAALFVALKLKGFVVEYCLEFAKQLVWTKQFSRLDNQHYVTSKQYELFKQMNNLVDFIITDGPLCYGLYYNLFNKNNTSDKDKTNKWINQCMGEFLNINIFLNRGCFAYEREGRIQTEQEAREIDVVLQHILKQNDIAFVQFDSGADQENIGKIVEYIFKYEYSSPCVPLNTNKLCAAD